MTDLQFAQALALHGRTHRLKEQTGGAMGHADISSRSMAIAEAAERGKVLAPIEGHPADSHAPEFYEAAAARGLLVDEHGVQVPFVPFTFPPPGVHHGNGS